MSVSYISGEWNRSKTMTSICSLTPPLLSKTNPFETSYRSGRKLLRNSIHFHSLRSPWDTGCPRVTPRPMLSSSDLCARIVSMSNLSCAICLPIDD